MDYNITYREKDKGIQCIISYKDSKGKWKTKSRQGFKTQRESKSWQSKMVEELEKQLKLSHKLNEGYKEVTFNEFKDVHLKELALHKEPNSVGVSMKAFNKFGDLGDKAISDIKFLDIRSIVNDMLKEGLANSTINNYVSNLRILLDVAVEDYKIIAENPLDGNEIKLPKIKEQKKVKVLNREELGRLINTIEPKKDKMIAIIASNCGLRAGEIIGLTWADIDFENMNIEVNKQWKELRNGKQGFGTLKTSNSYRKVPFSPYVSKELKEYKENNVREFGLDRLFIEKTTNNVCARFNKKIKRLGFDISLHNLRHTYATNLIAIGIDFKTISEFMGDTVEVVIKTYAHFNEDMYESGRDKINNFL